MSDSLSRREILAYSAAFGSAFLAAQGIAAAEDSKEKEGEPKPKTAPAAKEPGKKYDMRKSINLWALPYPQKMTLKQCFELCKDAGFEAVEVNYALEGDLSPDTSPEQIKAIGEMARKIGIQISGVCSFLFWPYAFTHQAPERRKKGLELAEQMIRAARLLGTDNLLVVPGSVYAPWIPDEPPVPHDVALERATAEVKSLIPSAKKHGVSLNMENIFAKIG